jgi:branched-chain amino acid transport system substrate-binding protein
MVPGGWYGGIKNPLSEAMVNAYIAKYGGTAADINADVAEAYSVGEVAASAATATKSLDNKKITAYLHSGVTLQTVQGPVKFNSSGENTVAQKFIFQWQKGGNFVQVLPAGATGSVPIVNPKPNWSS